MQTPATAAGSGATAAPPRVRFAYLDYLKAIAIFMVIFYHVAALWGGHGHRDPSRMILNAAVINLCAVCVPIFFLVNGALLFSGRFQLRKHVSKTAALVITYFAWRAITIPATSLLNREPFGGAQLPDYLSAVLGARYPDYNLTHFWFIPVLIGLYVVFPLLKFAYDSGQHKALLFFTGAVFTATFLGNFVLFLVEMITSVPQVDPRFRNSPFSVLDPFYRYSYSFVYFVAGGYLHRRFVIEKQPISAFQLALAWLLGYISVHALQLVKMHVYQGYFDAVVDSYPELCTLLASVAVFLLLSKLAYRNRLLNALALAVSVNTLGIYYIHAIFRNAHLSYMLFPTGSLATALSRAVAILIVSLLLAMLLRRIPGVRRLVQLG